MFLLIFHCFDLVLENRLLLRGQRGGSWGVDVHGRLTEVLGGSLNVLYHILQLRYLVKIALNRLTEFVNLLDMLLKLILSLFH